MILKLTGQVSRRHKAFIRPHRNSKLEGRRVSPPSLYRRNIPRVLIDLIQETLKLVVQFFWPSSRCPIECECNRSRPHRLGSDVAIIWTPRNGCATMSAISYSQAFAATKCRSHARPRVLAFRNNGAE